jgi:excisionase family DNA binding protein
MTTFLSPTPADQVAAQIQLERLRAQTGQVSTSLTEALESFLGQLAAGKAVQVITLEHEIGTQQAAELLQVSRPYLVKLIEQGVLSHRKVGPRRRLSLDAVLAYKAGLDRQRQTELRALADELQDVGLG